MTRILLIVTTLTLVATTAFADVAITVTQEDLGVARISYTATEDVRAFALDITIEDSNAEINDIHDFNVGDNNGYGIFPGRFREAGIDPANPDWYIENYNPTAAGGDPDRQPGIPFAGITVEMGSLYTAGNEPPAAGTLFIIDLNDNGSTDCNVCVSLNETRGGIVNENAEEVATTNLPFCTKILLQETDCLPSGHPDHAEWVAVGKPTCWCFPRQCHGDADGKAQGGPKPGYNYVGTDDLAILVSAWEVKEPTKGPGIATIPNGICADFAHDEQGGPKPGYNRVGTNDLALMVSYWEVKEPTKGPGVPADCGGNVVPE